MNPTYRDYSYDYGPYVHTYPGQRQDKHTNKHNAARKARFLSKNKVKK